MRRSDQIIMLVVIVFLVLMIVVLHNVLEIENLKELQKANHDFMVHLIDPNTIPESDTCRQVIWKWERGDPIENLPPFLQGEASVKIDTIYWSKEEVDVAQREWERRKRIDSLQAIWEQRKQVDSLQAILEGEMTLTFMKEELIQLRELLDDIWDIEIADGDGFGRTPFSKHKNLAKSLIKRIDRVLDINKKLGY